MGQMKYLKLPPNFRLWLPSCQLTESRASRIVSQACIWKTGFGSSGRGGVTTTIRTWGPNTFWLRRTGIGGDRGCRWSRFENGGCEIGKRSPATAKLAGKPSVPLMNVSQGKQA